MITCRCGKEFASAPTFFRHRDSGVCPYNAPSGAKFAHWALHVRARTTAEEERDAKNRERLEALRNDPVAQENARKNREARKEFRRRRRALAERRGR